MRIIVAGGGRIGSQLARSLVDEGHVVTVIDRSETVCRTIFEDVGAVTICGEATDARVLEQAGIGTADIAAGLLSRDADTLAFAVLVRSMSPARVMVRIYDKAYREACRLAGVRDVIAEAEAVVGRITTSIAFPQVLDSLPIGRGEAVLFEIPIPTQGTIVGVAVAELQRVGFPRDCILVCLIRPDGTVDLPSGPTIVEGGDLALVVARREQIAPAIACLTAVPPVQERADPIVTALRSTQLFRSSRLDDLDDVLHATRRAHLPAGDYLYRAGEPADCLYVVLSGEISLLDTDGAVRARVAPGEALGEADVLLGNPRGLSARAEVDTTVVTLRRDSLQQAADANPSLALAMSRSLGDERGRLEEAGPSGWASVFRRPWRRE